MKGYDVVLPPMLKDKPTPKSKEMARIVKRLPICPSAKEDILPNLENAEFLSTFMATMGDIISRFGKIDWRKALLDYSPFSGPHITLPLEEGELYSPLFSHWFTTFESAYEIDRRWEKYRGVFMLPPQPLTKEALKEAESPIIIADFGCGRCVALEELVEKMRKELGGNKEVKGLGITLYMEAERWKELRDKGIYVIVGDISVLSLKPYEGSVLLAFDVLGALHYSLGHCILQKDEECVKTLLKKALLMLMEGGQLYLIPPLERGVFKKVLLSLGEEGLLSTITLLPAGALMIQK